MFFSCEDSTSAIIKSEGAEPLYSIIDDSLNYEEALKNRHCLDFSCERPLFFPKRVLKKIMWQPLRYGTYSYDNYKPAGDDWIFGVLVKAKDLTVENDGYEFMRSMLGAE